ncbi:MAG: UpxY family transcription antiterminator [Bryobacterales bacterium]|nr:UpxY family transcription antiterminator [Bryobacterales bacterium]
MSTVPIPYEAGVIPPSVPPVEPRWYAVHTRSRFEKIVSTELGRHGIETYWPAFDEVHQWKDRKKRVERPVFPGYLFVRIPGVPVHQIQVLRTNGVVRILGGGAGIEPVPDREIDSIRRLLVSNKHCYLHPSLREGTWVRVTRGPLRDVEGRLLRLKSETRLVLTVDLLSQSVATEIDIHDVEPIRRDGHLPAPEAYRTPVS